MEKKEILVIRHGALGDFILSFGPFQTIRKAWPDANITLLTTAPYANLAEESGIFDTILVDVRPKFWKLGQIISLWRKLARPHFNWVYDLQTSDRSSFYYNFFLLSGQKPNWSGIKRGCSHPDTNEQRTSIHTIDRQKKQLALCGLNNYVSGDLSFLKSSISHFKIKKPYLLIIPGCAPHRPEKRWPHYDKLIPTIIKNGITCVALGSEKEKKLINELKSALTKKQQDFFIDLSGKTSFGHIAELARQAAGAIGNDTGPMHIIAAVHCPSLTVFSKNSSPARCAPRGKNACFLQEKEIKYLPPKQVWDKMLPILQLS